MPKRLQFAFTVLLLNAVAPALQPGPQPPTTVTRWAEGQPGCTFSADHDGRYRYGLWTERFGVVLAVDSQELQKALRRTEPVFAVQLTVRYRAGDAIAIGPRAITLEFAQHSHQMQPAVDPAELAARFQADIDEFKQDSERRIAKHPEKHTELEAALQEQQQSVAGMLAFLEARSLRPVQLDSAHRDADGWIYFSARSKWIGDWKKREEFVLRFPLRGQVIEFPFALPPSAGDLLLRRR